MSWIAICTDASALAPPDVVDGKLVTVVPIPVVLDDEPFDERLGADAFYASLEAGARASTSQPSPGDFLAAYAAAAERGASEVISIHSDARSSGTVAAAELAAREAPVPVTVVDAQTASFGVGVCVRAAAQLVRAGESSAEIAGEAGALGAALQNAFVAPAAPGGRVDATSGWAVLSFASGAVQPVATAGSEPAAVAAMTAAVAASRGSVRAAVGHAAASTERAADELAEALAALSNVAGVERYRVGPAVGAHTGPHSFGLFWWPVTPEARS